MSRYIDGNVLKANINTAFWSEIGKLIDNAPSIDIVRCKECKHWWECKPRDGGDCDHYEMNTKPDDYCSRGEREGE